MTHKTGFSTRIDETGNKYGILSVLEYAGIDSRSGNSTWLCLCDCGKKKVIRGSSLRRGDTSSCGCREAVSKTHGLFGTAEYNVWCSIVQRCYNSNHAAYADYGGRGIVMCHRWRESFSAFIEDMGERPSCQLTLDRIDNDGPYSPENCRWATRSEQMNNTRANHRLEHDGKVLTLAQWGRISGLPDDVIGTRLRNGWDVQRALTTPVGKRGGPRKDK